MSEIKLISPLLDNIVMGDPISDRCGVRACPAMSEDGDTKYITKIISSPASRKQLDALLLSGAYPTEEDALVYFKELADGIVSEAETLQKLSALEGFSGFEGWQVETLPDNEGYDVYLLSTYKKSLERVLSSAPMTHLAALNLGMDLCSALSVCRQFGYLYIDLKPSNVYITGDNSFKIGDIGFMRLDSLKYASLPDRYRSAYTAPEIQDAYSSINTTADIYAVGMILYQVFNGGNLPHDEDAPLTAPDYADYEMAEIILKACAKNPEDRWQDPYDLGQALIGYMQRNGAFDEPIIPQAKPVETVEEDTAEEDVVVIAEEESVLEVDGTVIETEDNTVEAEIDDTQPESESSETLAEADETATESDDDSETVMLAAEDPSTEVASESEATAESEVEENTPEEPIAESDDISAIEEEEDDETLPGAEEVVEESDDNIQISDEVTEILNQVDELIAHPTPDPVVAPEPIDVPVPPLVIDASDETEKTEPEENTDSQETVEETDSPSETDEETTESENEAVVEPLLNIDEAEYEEEKKSHWLRNTILVFLLLGLIAAGIVFYKYFYLQNIDKIDIQGNDDSLTVQLTSEIDDTLLNVVCADTYGNKQVLQPENGVVTFENLTPNTAYTVRVEIEGFHKLTGQTTAAHSTPKRTNIAQFLAHTGPEDGSVILSFTIEGRDSDEWAILYSAEGEPAKAVTFSGHMHTITELEVGKEYKFTLEPVSDITIDGNISVNHTASKVVRAQNLRIAGIYEGNMEVLWDAPEGSNVASWTVYCHNEDGFEQTIVTDTTAVTFENVSNEYAYTIEVTAAGMSSAELVSVDKNAVTVKDLAVSKTDTNELVLTWGTDSATEVNNWTIQYSIDGTQMEDVVTESTEVKITPFIPGAVYSITVIPENNVPVFDNTLAYTAGEAEMFAGYSVETEEMYFRMCRYPGYQGWNRYDLSYSDYTTEFEIGEDASFLVKLEVGVYGISYDEISILYVIHAEDGTLISCATQTSAWSSLWYNHYGEFDIPEMPTAAGNYTIDVYFNGYFVNQETFTVIE